MSWIKVIVGGFPYKTTVYGLRKPHDITIPPSQGTSEDSLELLVDWRIDTLWVFLKLYTQTVQKNTVWALEKATLIDWI